MMPRRRPSSPRTDCTCAKCCEAARMTRLFRIILTGSAAAWALIAAALTSLIA